MHRQFFPNWEGCNQWVANVQRISFYFSNYTMKMFVYIRQM